MKARTTLLAATTAAVVLAAAGIGVAAAPGDDPTSAPAPPPSPVAAAPVSSDPAQRTVVADEAGVVRYDVADVLTLAAVVPATGWTGEIEQSRGREIEVVLTGPGGRVDVEVELEDGVPRERIRRRAADAVDDDHGDHDDHSGRGRSRGGDDEHDDDGGRSGRDHPEDD